MKKHLLQNIITMMLIVLLNSVVQAAEYQNIEVTKVLTSTTTSNGEPLRYLDTRHPEVTVLLVRILPGQSTGWHKHSVPVYAYMLEGSITVELKDGKQYSFKKGEAILEVMNTLHNGYNKGNEAATLLVFYTGAVGVKNVIKEEAATIQPSR